MKIQFTTGVAGARFAYEPGEEVDLPVAQAREFVRARQAVIVPDADAEKAVVAAPETTSGRGGRRRGIKNLGGLLPG